MQVTASPGVSGERITNVNTSAYLIPTDLPGGDGTLEWDSTTLVVVEIGSGTHDGLGYTYGSAATARIIDDLLVPQIQGEDPLGVPHCWEKMTRAVRNQGRPGVSSMAVAAVDNALWDLKAKLLGVSLADLVGMVREAVPIYGSGGFTTYSVPQLQAQLAGWVEQGIRDVKMKIGSNKEAGLKRTAAAREAIGAEAGLFVDANSAFTRKEALQFMEASVEHGVCWMEQPLPPEDLEGLRLLRDRAPATIEIADGEYGYDAPYFRRMLEAGAVDVLMPDATRCAGITGFLRAAALCEAYRMPMSSHCAPLLHCHLGCGIAHMRHAEYFHDHARIEEMFFAGAPRSREGKLAPDRSRPGLGVEFRRSDACRYQIYGRKDSRS